DAALGSDSLHLHQQHPFHRPADVSAAGDEDAAAPRQRADRRSEEEGQGRGRPARRGPRQDSRLSMATTRIKARKDPLFGAAVVKAVLRKRERDANATSALYQGILRDLHVTDEDVERYLAEHAADVEEAIR